nr:hypothetical protein [Planctomycetota bacterium]
MTLVQSAVGSLRDVNPCLVQLFPVTCPPDLENHETKSCCTLIPCCLCFWLTDYDGNVTYGEACWSDIHNSYRGTLDGDADLKLFEFRWERDTAAPGDPCQHVVNFDVDEVYRENSCDCETPEGIASTIYGDIQWQRQVKQKRIIWDPPGTCETHCPQCTCVADKVCITWEKHAGTGSCSEPCLQSILEAEWNCDTEQFEVIFEPDCCGDEDPVTIYIRLDEASGADCAWVLEVDGVVADTSNALGGQ